MGLPISQLEKYLVVVILLGAGAFAQNSRIDQVALGPRGPIPAATVAVCTQPANTSTQPCSPLATLCSSLSDATCVQPNPLTADSLGNYHFYVKQTQTPVTIQIYGPQVASPFILPDQSPGAGVGTNNVFTGSASFTGGFACKYQETIRCVDAQNTAGWSGADIGAWVNAAYADLPAPIPTGTSGRVVGRIDVFPKVDGSCYSATTPISFGTNGKPVNVDFHGACVNYSGLTSGNAILVDSGQGTGYQWSISNLVLLGACATTACSGVTTVGIQLGSVNGAVSGQVQNTSIGEFSGAHGFLAAIQSSGSIAYINKFDNVSVNNNNIGLNLIGGSEGTKFYGGSISRNVTGLQTSGSGSAVQFIGTQFDDNTTTAYNRTTTTTFDVDFVACHWENAGLGALQVLTDTSTGGVTRYLGGDAQEDRTSGTNPQFFTMGGNMLYVSGMQLFAAGITVTQAVNITSGSSYLGFVLNGGLSVITSNTANRWVDATMRADVTVPTVKKNFFADAWGEQSSPTSVAGQDICYGDSTAHALKCSYNNGTFFQQTQTIASGTAVMTTAGITAGNCGTTVTVSAAGVATADTITWAFNAAPAGSNAGLVAWPTSGNVNFAYCPNSAETPAAATINWRVIR